MKCLSYSCSYVRTPVKGLVCVGLSGSLFAACVSVLCQLPSDLSILSCLLREGWISLSEQYPHASLGVFKICTSSSLCLWEGKITASHKATR